MVQEQAHTSPSKTHTHGTDTVKKTFQCNVTKSMTETLNAQGSGTSGKEACTILWQREIRVAEAEVEYTESKTSFSASQNTMKHGTYTSALN